MNALAAEVVLRIWTCFCRNCTGPICRPAGSNAIQNLAPPLPATGATVVRAWWRADAAPTVINETSATVARTFARRGVEFSGDLRIANLPCRSSAGRRPRSSVHRARRAQLAPTGRLSCRGRRDDRDRCTPRQPSSPLPVVGRHPSGAVRWRRGQLPLAPGARRGYSALVSARHRVILIARPRARGGRVGAGCSGSRPAKARPASTTPRTLTCRGPARCRSVPGKRRRDRDRRPTAKAPRRRSRTARRRPASSRPGRASPSAVPSIRRRRRLRSNARPDLRIRRIRRRAAGLRLRLRTELRLRWRGGSCAPERPREARRRIVRRGRRSPRPRRRAPRAATSRRRSRSSTRWARPRSRSGLARGRSSALRPRQFRV